MGECSHGSVKMTDRGQRYLLLGLCLFQTCFALLVSVTLYILSIQIWELKEDVRTLRNIMAEDAVIPLAGGGLKSRKHSRRESTNRRVALDGSGLFHDLLVAQENILASHCTNDSKLCMKGPKGDKGDRGEPGSAPVVTTSRCECLEKPIINIVQSATSINCSSVGKPNPYIALYEGTRLLASNKDVSGSSVSIPRGQNKGKTTYRCIARNIIGDDTKQLVVG